jgi:tRNA (guanine37-N1)-methyltransferase
VPGPQRAGRLHVEKEPAERQGRLNQERLNQERVVVAHVNGPHGIKGALRLESLTDDPSRFAVGSQLTPEGEDARLTITASTSTPRGLIVRFAEVPDRDAADALRGVYLEAPAPPRRRGAYLWHEVVGTRVEGRSGETLGTVREIIRAGGGEVAIVEGPRGELLIPLVRAFVPRFAPRRGVMVVDTERLGIATEDRAERAPRARRAGRGRTVPGPQATAAKDLPAKPARSRGKPRPARAAAPVLEVDILSLFPAMLEGPLAESIPGRAQQEGIAAVRFHDLRRWGIGRHRSVDDYTFGGGAGMVMRPEPVAAAVDELRRPGSTVVLLDPAGQRFDQAVAQELAGLGHLVLVCGRYEGVDERIRGLVDREISIGDYVLSGGEAAAIVVVDAVLRLLPGAIESASVEDESFARRLLEYPQYTRPREFRGVRVPDVLVSGDHGAVEAWRLKEALRRTLRRRPDLLHGRELTARERELLSEIELEEGTP